MIAIPRTGNAEHRSIHSVTGMQILKSRVAHRHFVEVTLIFSLSCISSMLLPSVLSTTMSTPPILSEKPAPENIYYSQPLSPVHECLYAFGGAITCVCLTDYLNLPRWTLIVTWVFYFITVLIMFIVFDPRICIPQRSLDEAGQEVTSYRPLIGWKSCEHRVRLEKLASGEYGLEHGFADERIHDVSSSGLSLSTFS